MIPKFLQLLTITILLQNLSQSQVTNEYKIEITKVYDADTIIGNIHLGIDNITISTKTIRFKDIDAYEISKTRKTQTITEQEIEKGKQARDHLKTLIEENKLRTYIIPSKKQDDPYGRFLADLIIYTKTDQRIDIKTWLTQNNYTRTPTNKQNK